MSHALVAILSPLVPCVECLCNIKRRRSRINKLPILVFITNVHSVTPHQVRAVLEEIMEKLPEEFNMVELMGKAEERTPYQVVALQECERMNFLTREIRRSLQELSLGLKVKRRLNILCILCQTSLQEIMIIYIIQQYGKYYSKAFHLFVYELENESLSSFSFLSPLSSLPPLLSFHLNN